MKKYSYFILLSFCLCFHMSLIAQEKDNGVTHFLKNLFNDNADYVTQISKEKFESFKDSQTPRATVIMCSDSRVQSDAFHRSPVNDLFFIRNIGNQIMTTEGSVEYGVYHLNTPVLLIIGHTQCGAIKASMEDYRNESIAIQKELDHLDPLPQHTVNENVIENVHQQVDFSLKKFKDKIDKKELIVLGTVYDFRDDFKKGHGRLLLINFNGERDPAAFKKEPLLEGISITP